MEVPASTSEDHGVALLADNDLLVYSIGISTGGTAEMRMASDNHARHIVATTIDEQGLAFARERIAEAQLNNQIETKLEGVAEPLPYPADHFDFVYARLVLHYLPEEKLRQAVAEINRVLKPGGRLFVVVRSTDCPDAKRDDVTFDPETHLTTGAIADSNTGRRSTYSRFFHTEASISEYLQAAGFSLLHIKKYDEQLYIDFMRTQISPEVDNVIEVLAKK